MSTGLLEQPPVETRAAPAAPAFEGDGDAQGGYPMKFSRRRRKRSAADAARAQAQSRGRRRSKGRRRGLRAWLPWLLAPGLVAVVAVSILGAGAGRQVPLPPMLEPSAFTGVLAFDETARAGTLFHAKLHEAPTIDGDRDFRSRIESVARIVQNAGYDSLLIQAPDGTTLVSGAVASPTFAPPGTHGT